MNDISSHSPPSEGALREKINLETATIEWRVLQPFFAAGKVICAADTLDLVEVACAVHQDDSARVSQWMADKHLGQVSDEQAKDWFARDASLWAVVIKPWVIVQDKHPQ